MIKKILVGIIAFVFGIVVSIFSDSFFREQIQYVFIWTTSNRIEFFGKNFYLFNTNFYYVSFGLACLIFSISNMTNSSMKIAKNVAISMTIFTTLIFIISAINANLKIIECTACNNGVLSLHWNSINYGFILGFSALLSIIPSLISVFRYKNYNLKKLFTKPLPKF